MIFWKLLIQDNRNISIYWTKRPINHIKVLLEKHGNRNANWKLWGLTWDSKSQSELNRHTTESKWRHLWPILQLIQGASPGGKICNHYILRHPGGLAKCVTDICGAAIYDITHVTDSIPGPVVPLALFENQFQLRSLAAESTVQMSLACLPCYKRDTGHRDILSLGRTVRTNWETARSRWESSVRNDLGGEIHTCHRQAAEGEPWWEEIWRPCWTSSHH